MYKRIHPYDPQLVAEMMAIEQEVGCITVGSKLAWPKPVPRRVVASKKSKSALRSKLPQKRRARLS